MEAKFKNGKYSALHVKDVLTFDTESVPVQQFQARCADQILQSTRHPLSKVLPHVNCACQRNPAPCQHQQAAITIPSVPGQAPLRTIHMTVICQSLRQSADQHSDPGLWEDSHQRLSHCLTAACLLQSELQEALNVALRVRDSLLGIDSNPRCPHDLWAAAMAALKGRNRSLDAQNVDRLFGRDNRQVPPHCLPPALRAPSPRLACHQSS